MKIIFMGTPAFSVPILNQLHQHFEIISVITQPDKKVGRKQILTPSPVKLYALEHNIPLLQPEKIKDITDDILKLEVDLIVTAAYGQFIPESILHHPRYRAINVHGSLLPKYRGGAPIQKAIMNGESTTGITIMMMEKRMDSGDILVQKSIEINHEDTADTMFEKLSLLGASIIIDAIRSYVAGKISPIKQDESQVSYAYNLTKADERLDFAKPAKVLVDQIRGLSSNPGAYFLWDDKVMKVYQSKIGDMVHHEEVGTIIDVISLGMVVACGNQTTIIFDQIKPEGKNMMSVHAYINGLGGPKRIKNRRVL